MPISSRSEALRDLARKSIIESSVKDENAQVLGTLTIIYDHHAHGVTDKLLHIQHHHTTEILTTTHIHVDLKDCLEVLIVRGKAREVRGLSEKIQALKGVRHGGLVITRV